MSIHQQASPPCFDVHLKSAVIFHFTSTKLRPLGATSSELVEEEGAVEGIQKRQQPQGLPARGRQLAPLQLVQQVRTES